MRVFLILLFLITNFSSYAQYENSWRIKKTFQKTKIENDSVLTLTSFEERDWAGKLILKADFIPQENIQFLTRYIYTDTFVTKKIITEQKILDKDTVISVDSILREIRTDFHPIFEDSIGKDEKGRIKMTPQKLEKGHKIILATHYDTRYDAQGAKKKTDFSYYQLMHEYFIEFDSLERKVAEYSSIDKWEYDKVNFKKYKYDGNGFLSEIRLIHKEEQMNDTGELVKSILNLKSDSIFTESQLQKINSKQYSEINVYSTTGNKNEEIIFYSHDSSKVKSVSLYLYDNIGRLSEMQSVSDETKIRKTYTYLNKISNKIIIIQTKSQYKDQTVQIEQEIFKYNPYNKLLIESYRMKEEIRSENLVYEYIFH